MVPFSRHLGLILLRWGAREGVRLRRNAEGLGGEGTWGSSHDTQGFGKSRQICWFFFSLGGRKRRNQQQIDPFPVFAVRFLGFHRSRCRHVSRLSLAAAAFAALRLSLLFAATPIPV